MKNIEKLVNDLSSLTVLEAAELAKELENKWGISAMAAAPVAAAVVENKEEKVEKTEFDVKLVSFGAKKIDVIREVKSLLGLGLKESKELVEKAPVVLKQEVAKDEANNIKSKLEGAGAEVELA